MELVVEAPLIARSRRAGHFVIVRADEQGERIPLTIADSDIRKGTITLVIQQVGVSTHKICSKAVGEYLQDVVGPLGKATDIRHFGTVVCACGGVGAAPMLPIARALREAGNKVITVLAARTKELIILEEQLRECSDEVIVMTDDGTYGQKGLVTNGVEMVIQREQVDKCVPGYYDEVRGVDHQEIQCTHRCQPEHHYGGRNGHVRRVPCDRGRRDTVCLRGWSRV